MTKFWPCYTFNSGEPQTEIDMFKGRVLHFSGLHTDHFYNALSRGLSDCQVNKT